MIELCEKTAEEYATENLPDGYTKINYVKKQAFIDGYAQGQQDLMVNGGEVIKKGFYVAVCKENESLKDTVIEQRKQIKSLKLIMDAMELEQNASNKLIESYEILIKQLKEVEEKDNY